MITIATDDLQLDFNDDINEEQQIQQYQFESPKDDFELVPDDPLAALQLQQEESTNKEELQQEESINKEELQQEAIQEESMNKEELQQEAIQEKSMNKEQRRKKNKEELTHEENKLLLTLLGITPGSVAIWIFN